MTLYLRQVGGDVKMHLRGTLDISALGLPYTVSDYSLSLFAHTERSIPDDTGAQGRSESTEVASRGVAVDLFYLPNDALTKIGTPPLQTGTVLLTGSPPFWFGFNDVTQTGGIPGAVQDMLYLPHGYRSGEFIGHNFIARSRSFRQFGISLGDRWGVSFDSGTGTQSMIFYAVPEPLSAVLLAIFGAAAVCRRC